MGVTPEMLAQLVEWGFLLAGLLMVCVVATICWWGYNVSINHGRIDAISERKSRRLQHKERLKELEVEAKRIDLETKRLEAADRHSLVHLLEYKQEGV